MGETIASISPGTYAIIAPLTPEQQLQLLDQDIHATAAIPTASDPVPCQAPRIEEKGAAPATDQSAPAAGTDPAAGADPAVAGQAGDTGSDSSTGSASRASLRCPVPAGTRIVAGLSLDVTVDLGSVTGVLTLPTTAVEGELASGTVYVLDPATGEPAPKPVALGKRGDGVVEITGGLAEGDEVLRFVPGVDNPDAAEGGVVQVW